jgi:hypothetical protein
VVLVRGTNVDPEEPVDVFQLQNGILIVIPEPEELRVQDDAGFGDFDDFDNDGNDDNEDHSDQLPFQGETTLPLASAEL